LKRKKNADAVGKFQFAWEGPYMVSSSVWDGAFRLKDETGVELPHSWNVDNLCKFFP
jgi:cytolysin (calcineurin-like family phosphatase)